MRIRINKETNERQDPSPWKIPRVINRLQFH